MRKSLFRNARPWMMLFTGILFAFFLVACGEDSPAQYGLHTTLNTAGPVADSERFLFYVILGIATTIFVIVEFVLVFSIIRYRSRPGAPNPRQNHGNLRVEVLWTVIPALILFVILGFTIQGLFQVSTVPNDKNTVTVEAIGHQWWWEFYYPQYNITTADSLHAPVGTVVNVELYSNNVIHSFWIPALTGKTDDIPGHNNTRWFRADKTGVYYGECAEFCGAQHAHMAFNAIIDNQDTFNTWVTTQQQAAVAPTGSLEAQGAKVFNGVCATCHGIVGHGVAGSEQNYIKGYQDPRVACDNPNVACKVGPNLTHFAQRNLIAGGILIHERDKCLDPNNLKDCNLAKWLADPQGIKPGNDMIVSVSPSDIKALVAYLESLN